ncbi:transcriptional regulator [Vibrio nigripulchritudo]|uniref:IclR family transcriptional regulator n=1 Tax=Vibrio nigripulchritudo TaxID=28173 RepID=UPI00190C5956|nr:IclR family transcriptional regulator C-terminal domain-containing protein [Vibrio nigripulchritudo]BCL73428.1 transcriptional regulator [Vibrio nigripulchritudo]BDU34795.1 transcriptional regulator [Vibrio nigripulchritudo]
MESTSEERKNNALYVGAVEKAFVVLESFIGTTESLSLTEIVKLTGMTKSAAQRYIYTLETLGYLVKDPDSKRYKIAMRSLFPASQFLSTDPLINAAYPHIVQLRQQVDARIGLSVPFQDDIAYLIPLQSNKEAYQNDFPGFRLPLFCTTSGRLFLSSKTSEAVQHYLEHSNLKKVTPYTQTDPNEIIQEVSTAREQGFCITHQEVRQGNLNLSVPIYDSHHQVKACLVAVVQTPSWDEERLKQDLLPLMRDVAARINPNNRLGL